MLLRRDEAGAGMTGMSKVERATNPQRSEQDVHARSNFDVSLSAISSRIQQSTSGDQVWGIMDEVCTSTGMFGACCRCFPNGAAAEPVVFFSKTSSFSPELESALQSAPGYLDAFLHASVNSPKPFHWGDVSGLLDPKSPQIESYKQVIEPLGDGVVVPVFGPLFRNGYFCFSGTPGRAYSENEMMLLHSISQTAYLKLCDLMYREESSARTLSSRELEIINIVARGKSSHVIAETLNVSVNTINTHLKRIFEKLDVTDRVSAVMRAYALGYIV